MIERAAGCLEKGGTCLSRTVSRTPLRSHRLLHSTFWAHGAGSIDLPSWWIALLQLPQAKETPKTAREIARPMVLDFLYPPATLAFIKNSSNKDLATFGRQRRARTVPRRSRAYASLTALASNEGSALHEAGLFAHLSRPYEAPDYKSREDALLTRLDQLLLVDDHEANHSELWEIYIDLRSRSMILRPRQIVRILRCLARSDSKENHKRLLELFYSIPKESRKSIHYSFAISSSLNHDHVFAAMSLHAEAMSNIHVDIGTSSLFSYLIERELWQLAIDVWRIHHEDPRAELWAVVDTIPLPELWIRASSAIDFAARIIELAPGSSATASQEFAIQLTLRSFALRSSMSDSVHRATNVYGLRRVQVFRGLHGQFHSRVLKPGVIETQYPNVDRHQQLFTKATKLQQSLSLYAAAIYQVLSFKSRLYTIQALKYYQAYRSVDHVAPSPRLLEALLLQLCANHSEAGMFLILSDYRHYFGKLSAKAFRLVIPEFAFQGNRRAVEDLLDEFLMQFGRISSSNIGNAILHVCIRRGEVKRAVETFEKMETRYRFKPDLWSYNAVIEAHARVGDIEGASVWYNRLLDTTFKPNSRTLIPLMAMFAKRGDLQAVQQLLRQSEAYNIETNIAMIDALVLAQINNDQLATAETLVYDALETVEKIPQKSRTRMWNYLLNAFAMRGDLDKLTALHRKMRDEKIPSNATTFAALMHGLSIKRQPAAANRIMAEVMHQLGILPTALHYAICMNGYLVGKNYRRIFTLYAEMLKHEVRPDTSVHNLLIRAAAAIDSQKSRLTDQESNQQHYGLARADQEQYELARQSFEQAMKDLDPVLLATTEPIKFVGHNRLDESFSSSYFSYLIFLYGARKAMEEVQTLYEKYRTTKQNLHMDVEAIPPIQMLSALMVANLRNKDFEAVDQCWQLSLQGARTIARRVGAKTSDPGWVLPARRFILNAHLRIYIRSLVLRSRLEDIPKILEQLQQCGYDFDSRTWNYYVQVLVQNNQILLAFELCEKELMSGWEGWEPLNVRYIKRALHFRQPKQLEPHRRLPSYETLVYLAAAFVDAQSSVSTKGGKPISQYLFDVAPKAVDAVYHLPRFNDPLQRRLLHRSR